MKILQIINNLTSGGAEKLLFDLCKLLKKEGHHCEILLLSAINNVYVEELIKDNISVTVLGNSNFNLSYFFKIRRIIKNGNYDVVHSHLFPSQYYLSLALLWLPRTFVTITTEHSTYNKRRNYKLFQVIEKYIYSSYNSIICISQESAYQLAKHIENNKNIIVIPNGISLENISKALPLEDDDIFSSKNIYLIVVGRFVPGKRQDLVLKALTKTKQNVHSVFVGEGQLKSEMINLSKSLGVSDRTHFLGYRNDVPSLLKASDIVIVPSDWEGFGLVAAEGMAAGKPVVASNVQGLSEIVAGVGLLFERGNEVELASVIIKLIDSPEFYREVAIRCKVNSESLDIKNMVTEYLKVYKNIR